MRQFSSLDKPFWKELMPLYVKMCYTCYAIITEFNQQKAAESFRFSRFVLIKPQELKKLDGIGQDEAKR